MLTSVYASRCKKRDVHRPHTARRGSCTKVQVRKVRRMHIQRGTRCTGHQARARAHTHTRTRARYEEARVRLCVIVVTGIIKIRGLKLFRFMPALLSSCRRAGDEARFDSGEQISCIIQDPGPGAMQLPRSQWKRSSLGKKSFFNLSSRPNNARVGPLTPRASEERKTLYGGLLCAEHTAIRDTYTRKKNVNFSAYPVDAATYPKLVACSVRA